MWFIEDQYLVSSTKLTATGDINRFLLIIKVPIWIKDFKFQDHVSWNKDYFQIDKNV